MTVRKQFRSTQELHHSVPQSPYRQCPQSGAGEARQQDPRYPRGNSRVPAGDSD